MATVVDQSSEVPAVEFLGFLHEGVPCSRAKLDECIKFYTEVLGLRLMPRPKALDALVPGAWLSDAGNNVHFHLIADDNEYAPGPDAKITATGRHTAWVVKDVKAVIARMRTLGVPHRVSSVSSSQVLVNDPAGHTWEFQEPMR